MDHTDGTNPPSAYSHTCQAAWAYTTFKCFTLETRPPLGITPTQAVTGLERQLSSDRLDSGPVFGGPGVGDAGSLLMGSYCILVIDGLLIAKMIKSTYLQLHFFSLIN